MNTHTESPSPPDAVLVRRCLAGEREAWGLLVARFSGLVYFSILRTVGGGRHGSRRAISDDQVEEIHNSVFLALMENEGRRLSKWQGRCKLSHWIKVVTTHRTIDHLRSLKPTVALDDPMNATRNTLDLVADDGPDPEVAAMRSERARILSRAAAQLNPHDQTLLRMIFVEGRSGEAVARALGTTVGAVYTRKNRLRKRLRQALSRQAADLGASGAA